MPEESSNPDEGEATSRLDRELIELLNELRVALPGVQVLFAFLLAVPFTQRFAEVSSVQKAALFAALCFTTLSSVLLIAPSAHHRLQFRQRDKENLVMTANRLATGGTFFLALAMISVVFLITDVMFGPPMAPLTAAIAAVAFLSLWYAMPMARNRSSKGPADGD